MPRLHKLRTAGIAASLGLALAAAAGSPAQGPVEPVHPALPATADLIVLVRHAETAPDGTRNPPLSTAGRARAARLAVLLQDAALDAVHTTPYERTRATARPVAEAAGLAAVEYDPRALPSFADSLRRAGGRHLIVGHSNTTPALVELLGGDPGTPIAEHEHDRVYVLAPAGDAMTTLLLRY